MPVATAARKKSRREPSSDIEEDVASQKRADGIVDDEDDEKPRVKVKKEAAAVKKEKKPDVKKETKPVIDQDGDGDAHDSDSDDEGRIDLDNFGDHPILKDDMKKIRDIALDWSNIGEKMGQNFTTIRNVASNAAELAESEKRDKGIEKLDGLTRELIDLSSEMDSHKTTLDDLYQLVAQGEQISDIMARYEEGHTTKLDEYNARTSRKKYGQSGGHYTKFRQAVFEVENSDQAMPPISDFLPREDGDESDDDDFEMGGVTQDYKCPVTMKTLDNPVTSTTCNHSFDKEAMDEMFKEKRGAPIKCPVAGCKTQLSRSDVIPDKELARRVKAWRRRAERRKEDTVEEIIE